MKLTKMEKYVVGAIVILLVLTISGAVFVLRPALQKLESQGLKSVIERVWEGEVK